MANSTRCGSIRLWALIVSALLHTAALGIFTGVKMSGISHSSPAAKPSLTMAAVERIADRPKPVPRVEPILPPAKPQPKPAEAPLVAEIKQEQEPVMQEPADLSALTQTSPTDSSMIATETSEVEFFGQKSLAHQVCYVVDCSGSMYGQMYRVKEELKKSIQNLNPEHAFCAVFFMDGQEIMMSGRGLESATAVSKSHALELIEAVRPRGATDAVHALEMALRLKGPDGRGPEVVYFFTDGFDLNTAGTQGFVETILRLQRTLSPQTVIHTTGFNPTNRDRRMLELLAHRTGGGFMSVN